MISQEAERIDSWKMRWFSELGFQGEDIMLLLAWKTDPHDAERLLRRDGQRTSCTHAQALRILQPVDDVVVLA